MNGVTASSPAPRSLGANGAIIYDFFMVPGGAEHVTIEISQLIPDADVIVAATSSHCAGLLAPIENRLTTLRDRIPGNPAIRAVWAARTFRQLSPKLRDYDWVVYSGSFAPMAAIHRRNRKNYLYCHTIPRFAYDLLPFYREPLGPMKRLAFDWLARYVRHRYEEAFHCMTRVAANSYNTRQRIRQFLNSDADVIYPPCTIADFSWKGMSDYYVSTARLEPYKRVDTIIDAFRQMPDKKLVVASGGSDSDRLQRRAYGALNIEFSGWLSRAEMAELLSKCIASVYIPKDEDFGLSPIESMAAGKPVIGTAEGGLKETIIDGKTGTLLAPDPTAEAVVAAVERMTPRQSLSMRQSCLAQARRFGQERFRNEIFRFIGMANDSARLD